MFRIPKSTVSITSLMSAIQRGSVENPFKPMIVGSDSAMTYAEAYRWASNFALSLHSVFGVDSNSVVLLSLPNIVEFPVIVAALQVFGLRLALLSSTAEKKDFERAMTLLNPQLVIVGNKTHCRFVREIDPAILLMTMHCPHTSILRIEEIVDDSVLLPDYMLSSDVQNDAEVVLFSSGTTGEPKAIVNRSASFRSNALKLTSSLGVTSDDILYVPVPFSHVYGVIGIYAALMRSATLATEERYSPESSLSYIADIRATVYFGVATMYLREMRVNDGDKWDLSSLRIGLVAGASCPEAAIIEYERRYRCKLVQSYGMTETAATLTVCNLVDPVSIRSRSVGVPIPDVSINIDDTTGEILCKTPAMMTGVIDRWGIGKPDLDDDGWLRSGDLGSFDGDGRLYITGRIKDIVIRGGINIFPAEIESAYQTHPSIDECYLVGYPDPELGERTCLCVILKGSDKVSARDLRLFSQGRVEKCKMPDTVLKMDDLPRLPSGKIDRNALRDVVRGKLAKPMKPIE